MSEDKTSEGSPTKLPELPEAPPSHVIGQGYSANHKIPTVQSYREEKARNEKEAEEYASIVERRQREAVEKMERVAQAQNEQAENEAKGTPQSGDPAQASEQHSNVLKNRAGKKDDLSSGGAHDEKSRLMQQMNANKERPTDRFRKAEHGARRVRDPITGSEIIVKDADPKDFDHTHPATKSSNVLFHQYPPAATASVQGLLGKLRLVQLGVGGAFFLIWISVAWGSGVMAFMWRSTLCAGSAFLIMTTLGLVERSIEKEIERVRQDLSRQRGEAFSPPMPESVEWLNGLIKLLWGVIDPALFISVADMVEDILQQSLPGFIDAVRITDLGQGTNPLRITHIRALPDQPGDDGYPKTSWINQGDDSVQSKDTSGKEIAEDQAGDYYNFEVAFSYAALPGKNAGARAKNIHLLIEFFVGMFDWLHIPIPIWIQVEQIFGIVRLRCQFIPEYPFIRNVTFALCGVPAVEVSAIPMSKNLPNVLDLPFISSFVKMGIAAGTAELAVPKSMTINMQEMLSGAAVGDTRAVGIFLITIHHCEGLSAQDRNGKSDPYVVLAYAKFGKPLYSTRIILGDLNPVFEETCALLVTMDEIKAKEDLSAMLWDSDKMTADDLVGRVQIPVDELMSEPNKMHRREDGLSGFEDANDMPGKLVWSIGYFQKVPLKKDLERAPTVEEAKNAPAPTKTAPEMEMMPHDTAPNPAKRDLPPPPPDVEKTKPDARWPSGVLSVILHQVNNLERQNLVGKSGEREGEAGQDTDVPSEQADNLPSGYGEFIINDEMVYKTRVKQYSTNPYFEAGHEMFIRDFTNTVVRVVIRDSRLREADPVMGIVSVRLSEVFAEASSVTQMYAITEGVGFGKANISFAFRGVQCTLPPNMRGWDTGTLEINHASFTVSEDAKSEFELKPMRLRAVTSDKMHIWPKKDGEVKGDTLVWDMEEKVRLPIYRRYQGSLTIGLGRASGPLQALHIKDQPDAVAVLWLQDLTDDIEQEVKLPVLSGEEDDLTTLRQNAINDQTAKHHKFKVIGFLTIRLKLDSGLDEDHELIKKKLRLSQSRRHALEAYDHIEGEAEIARKQQAFDDDGVIDKDEQKEIDEAHHRQLISRGRGPAQFKPYRTAKWMKRGLRDRIPIGKDKTREPTVQTEA